MVMVAGANFVVLCYCRKTLFQHLIAASFSQPLPTLVELFMYLQKSFSQTSFFLHHFSAFLLRVMSLQLCIIFIFFAQAIYYCFHFHFLCFVMLLLLLFFTRAKKICKTFPPTLETSFSLAFLCHQLITVLCSHYKSGSEGKSIQRGGKCLRITQSCKWQ